MERLNAFARRIEKPFRFLFWLTLLGYGSWHFVDLVVYFELMMRPYTSFGASMLHFNMHIIFLLLSVGATYLICDTKK